MRYLTIRAQVHELRRGNLTGGALIETIEGFGSFVDGH